MTILDLSQYYSHFIKGHGDVIHLAAHSHHFWPDVSRQGHMEYWDDCAKTSDHKWDRIFAEIIPYAQKQIASLLNLDNQNQIVFAPNTHELATRLLSTFIESPSLKILTTNSEFHSWKRQVQRLEELSSVHVTWLDTSPLLNDREQFFNNIKDELKKIPDIFFISQVFFDSGLAITDKEFEDIYKFVDPKTTMVIDGYHGFAAIPTDLSNLEGKVFYIAGGYKYAQAGEGAAFMVIPNKAFRPGYTGWFAQFANLSQASGQNVGYSNDFMSFMGSTQDCSGLYRFKKVWELFNEINLTIPQIHNHVQELQKLFLEQFHGILQDKYELTLLKDSKADHGHFLTYLAKTEQEGAQFEAKLKSIGILVDRRGARIRFGLGLYHTKETIKNLQKRFKSL